MAFRYFVGVVHSPSVYPEYEKFVVVVNKYLEMPPFDFTNPFNSIGGLKIIRPESAYLYDAVWLYAKAVHQVIEEGRGYRNGTLLIDRIKHTTYKTRFVSDLVGTSEDSYLASRLISSIFARRCNGLHFTNNGVGDTEGNFSLVARNVHANDGSQFAMYPVGVFRLNENLTALPGKGDVLTYWLTTEDRMKRLNDSRIERYMSEKRSPANQANNNIDCNTCGSEIKCDTHWEYSVPSEISSDSETKSSQLNRPPL